MRSFIREKKIYCGKQYREVDIFSYTDAQCRAVKRGTRSKKIKESEPKQKNLNDKNARRYFTQTAELNFGCDPEALHVSATYSNKYLPETVEEAEREVRNYLRRVQYERKKEGLPPLKYIAVTERGKRGGRYHHHITVNGGIDRDTLESMWEYGYANSRRLQFTEDGLAGLGNYIVKSPVGGKAWTASKNLVDPEPRTRDGRISGSKGAGAG